MSANFSPNSSLGSFLLQNEYFSNDPQQFLLQITKLYADIARYVNVRQIGIFDLLEVMDGEQWFNTATPTVNQNSVKRFGFRQVYNITTPIAPGATSTTAYNITGFSALTFVHAYGMAVTASDQRPIPYSSVTNVNQQIELKLDTVANNIVLINGSAAPSISSAIIVLEYLKN